ncbi:MAG: nucleotidyltransferase domain-containing protein [Candidatus Binataceae bacterium]
MLRCARCTLSDRDPAITAVVPAAADDDIDWQLAFDLAGQHGVLPLVYRALGGGADLPADAALRLRREYYGNSLCNLKLDKELARIAQLLQREGVPLIVFKGPLLAVMAYGDLSMRQFTDLDILIHPRDLERAAVVLMAAGYRPRRYREGAAAECLAHYSEDEFFDSNRNCLLDLHWELTPDYFPFGPDADLAWRRAIPVEADGVTINTLAPLDLLMFLCAHGVKHGWRNLGWVCDIAALLRCDPALDQRQLLAEATRLRCRRMLLLGMLLAHEMVAAPLVPALLAAASNDLEVPSLSAQIRWRMLATVGQRQGLFQEWIVPLRTIEGRRRQLVYLTGRALRPTIEDVEFMRLPRPLYSLYYLLRPCRLALQQGGRLFHEMPLPGRAAVQKTVR